jgi:DNA modification methylase
VKLYNEDCFEVFRRIGDESVDAVITDPPYAIGYENKHEDEEFAWDAGTSTEYKILLEKFLSESFRVLKPGGTLWFSYGFTMIREVLWAIDRSDFVEHLENCICMARKKGRGAKNKLKSLREEWAHLTKPGADYTWNPQEYVRKVIVPYTVKNEEGERVSRGWEFGPDGKTPIRWSTLGNVCAFHGEPCWVEKDRGNLGNVMDLTSGLPLRFDGEPSDVVFFAEPSHLDQFQKRLHSAQKPIMMMVMLTAISTNPGDVVFDPFMGAGTEGVACDLLGREFIGVEREKGTFATAKNWIENYDREKARLFVGSHLREKSSKTSEVRVSRKRTASEKSRPFVSLIQRT